MIATAAVHIGGRLQVVDDEGRIVRLDPAGPLSARQAGFDWHKGDVIDPADLDKVAEAMADELVAALTQRPMPPAVEHLYLTDPIADFGRIDGIMFSGGVGEYVYGRETRDFGDMGRRLGHAIRRKVDAGALPWPLLPAGECIRATALGASEYSVQLTGNTSYISKPGELLPRRNLQVLQPPYECQEIIEPTVLAKTIREHFTAFDLIEGEGEVALALRWQGMPSYERIAAFAEGIRHGLRTPSSTGSRSTSCSTATSPRHWARCCAKSAGRERDIVHRRRDAARFRLHRPRPHPHALLHRAGHHQVAGVQREPAGRPTGPAHPSPRPRARPRPFGRAQRCSRAHHGHHHDHGHGHDHHHGHSHDHEHAKRPGGLAERS